MTNFREKIEKEFENMFWLRSDNENVQKTLDEMVDLLRGPTKSFLLKAIRNGIVEYERLACSLKTAPTPQSVIFPIDHLAALKEMGLNDEPKA